MSAAVFLDRDGVLVDDVDTLARTADIRVLPGVGASLRRMREAGLLLLAVTNQPIVARGLVSEAELAVLHGAIDDRLCGAGGVALDGWYSCPHHPEATLEAYRLACDCRKPRAGLLLRGAAEHGVDLDASFLVGDRPTDILAGAAAGCTTVLVHTGRHDDPPIVTSDPLPDVLTPDHTCADLAEAAEWILGRRA